MIDLVGLSADLRGARPDDPSDTLTEQVLSNIEFAVVHRVGDLDSAERFARLGAGEIRCYRFPLFCDSARHACPGVPLEWAP